MVLRRLREVRCCWTRPRSGRWERVPDHRNPDVPPSGVAQVRQSPSRRLQPSDLRLDRLKSPAPQLRTDHPRQRQPGPHHAFVPGRRPAPRGDGGAHCRGSMAVAAGVNFSDANKHPQRGPLTASERLPAVILCGQRTRSFESNHGLRAERVVPGKRAETDVT